MPNPLAPTITPSAPETLILDFLDWLASAPRSYGEVMEVWRTSCPRLTIFEDALDDGLIVRERDRDGRPVINLTARGRERLRGQSGGGAISTPRR
jgi:hypothetical protein